MVTLIIQSFFGTAGSEVKLRFGTDQSYKGQVILTSAIL